MPASTDDLNRWASKYLGESDEDADHAVDARWWTSSPAAAFAVLMKCVNSGIKLEMDVIDGRCTIELDEVQVDGPTRQMGRLMVEAAYMCQNGGKDEEDDT